MAPWLSFFGQVLYSCEQASKVKADARASHGERQLSSAVQLNRAVR